MTGEHMVTAEDAQALLRAQERRRNMIINTAHEITAVFCGDRDSTPHKQAYPGVFQAIEVLLRDLDEMDEAEWGQIKNLAHVALHPVNIAKLKP
jgi:uridylate kinase